MGRPLVDHTLTTQDPLAEVKARKIRLLEDGKKYLGLVYAAVDGASIESTDTLFDPIRVQFPPQRGDEIENLLQALRFITFEVSGRVGLTSEGVAELESNYPSIDYQISVLQQSQKTTEQEDPLSTAPEGIPRSKGGKRVFLVHGRDEGLKEAVARFIEKLDLECVILHEKPNQGKTLIEKLLSHGEGADFAIALWTADDEGRAKGEPKLKPRARQNVVFETGFFIGGLGRDRVCVILDPGIETPSDYAGVTYIPKADWKTLLLRELRASPLDVDPSIIP